MKKSSQSALQLWLTLAMIPVLAVIAVYIYGAIAFDDNTILEIDNTALQMEPEKIEGAGSDLDREFTAPLDQPVHNMTTNQRPSMLPDIASTNKEQSLTQMLSKKNENLKLGSNGHPMLVRVQENDNLPTLAARHLGSSAFWPYIYMVNKEKLSSPSALKAGMTLYLPDSVYYNMSLTDTLAIKRADDLAKTLQ